MALIDVVKFQGNDEEFVWKFPSENLRLGTQLVVKPGQTAFFVRGGVILDEFKEGTVTLRSGNIPLLTKLISLPFGGDTPFQAEVWFVNKISKLNTPWGIIRPIQIEDPKYGIIVPLRGFGQFGFRVAEPRKFLETIVGTAKVFTATQITDYFKGALLQSVTSNVGRAVIKQNISVLQISVYVDEVSSFCKDKIAPEFAQFGLELVNFFFLSINVPDDDPSLVKLKQIKEKAAELNVVGRDIYQLDKSMEVLTTAAANQGAGSTLMQSGMGVGMGLMMGTQVGQQAGQMLTQIVAPSNAQPPPIPVVPKVAFFVAVNGQQTGPFSFADLQRMHSAGTFALDSIVWHQGLTGWEAASTVAELGGLFVQHTPPPVPPMTAPSAP